MTTAYAAKVTGVTTEGVLVRVPLLGGPDEWGPLASSVPGLVEGDQVIVQSLGTSSDRLHVMGFLQGRPTRQDEVPGLVDRLDDIEARDAGQDARLAGIDVLDAAQNGRLSAVEGRATAVEGVNGTQNGRLTAVESKNTEQDGRLSTAETNIGTNGTRITNLDAAALHKTGAETKAGVLTLSDQPVIPAATLATSPIRADDVRAAGRVCRVEMSGTGSFPYTASTGDVWAAAGWVTDASLDKYSMATLSLVNGTLSYITIPFTAWWDFDYKQLWTASANSTNMVSCFVAVGAANAASTVARDARRYVPTGNDGSPVQAREKWLCTAGQRVYWGLYSDVNSSFLPVAPVSTNIRSRLIVSYHGPA